MGGSEESTDNDMFIGALHKNSNTKEWQITITLYNQRTMFKIVTGTHCNVISKQKYLTVCYPPMLKSMANSLLLAVINYIPVGKQSYLLSIVVTDAWLSLKY